MGGLNVFIAPESASHRDLCWSNQLGGSSVLTNCTPVAYVEKINIRMRRWKKVAEKIKIMMRRKRRVAAMRRPTQGWEDAEKISWKKSCSPSDRNLDPLLCSPTPHAVEAGRRILGKIRSQRPGRTCFYLLFLLMFICYLPARTCFYLLFFLLVICSLPFLDALASLKAMLDIK